MTRNPSLILNLHSFHRSCACLVIWFKTYHSLHTALYNFIPVVKTPERNYNLLILLKKRFELVHFLPVIRKLKKFFSICRILPASRIFSLIFLKKRKGNMVCDKFKIYSSVAKYGSKSTLMMIRLILTT